MIIILLYIVGIGALLLNIFGTRSFMLLDNPDLYMQASTIANESEVRISRITIALFILACMIGIAYGLSYWKHKLLPSQGLLITVAGLFLYAPIILSALVSENGGFSYHLFFFPLFIITAYLSPRFNPIQEIKKILPILLIPIYTSLIAIFLNPTWAYSSYLGSWIGVPFRLYGTSSHPNGLGYIALSCLILTRLDSKKSVWIKINIAAAVITLILSQSKTAWIALIIWMISEWIIKIIPLQRQTTSRALATTIMLFLLITTYMLLFEQDFLFSIFGFYISLTNRIDIWQITLKTWLNNPIFGYGPNLWNISFRESYGLLMAGQAHNQIMQTLGESGLIGILGLLFYYFVLIKLASRYVNVTNFVSFGFLIAVLIRSFTEVPLRTFNLDQSFLVHAIFFVILVNSESLLMNPQKVDE